MGHLLFQVEHEKLVYTVPKNLSVCLSVTTFDLNYFRTGLTDWVKNKFETSTVCS